MRFSGQTFSFMTEDSKIGWIKHYDGWNQVLLRFHSIIIITCHFDDVILCILVNFCTSYQVSNLPHFGDTITDPGSTIWNRKSTYRLSSSIIWDRQNSHKMFFCCLSFSFFHPILLCSFQKCGLGTLIMSGICSRLPRMPTLAF